MIQILALFLGFFLSYKIFINRGNYLSLLWVLIPLILINGTIVITNFPLKMPITRWLIFSLLFTHLYEWKKMQFNWRVFPLKSVTIFLIVSSLLIGLLDPRLSLFDKLYVPFRGDIISTYFILFLGYVTISNNKDIYRLAKPLCYTMIIVGLYGIFNFVTKSNPYYEFVLNNFFQGGEADLNTKLKVLDGTIDRYRASSTFNMTFNYGYVSSLVGVFLLFISSVIKKNKLVYMGIAMALLGAIICFSRTVLIACLFAVATYMLLAFKAKKIFVGVFTFILLINLGYFSVPPVQKSIDNILDVFVTGGEKTSGSSVSMRETQMFGAYNYFLQQPIRGNGYEYIAKELGWGDRDNAVLDSDMYGFESILYVWLIEQGLIGLISKITFFIVIIAFLISANKAGNKKIASLGLAMIFLFLMFSVGTGALGAWPLTMLFLGVIIKTIQINNNKNKRHNEIFNRHTRI